MVYQTVIVHEKVTQSPDDGEVKSNNSRPYGHPSLLCDGVVRSTQPEDCGSGHPEGWVWAGMQSALPQRVHQPFLILLAELVTLQAKNACGNARHLKSCQQGLVQAGLSSGACAIYI